MIRFIDCRETTVEYVEDVSRGDKDNTVLIAPEALSVRTGQPRMRAATPEEVDVELEHVLEHYGDVLARLKDHD